MKWYSFSIIVTVRIHISDMLWSRILPAATCLIEALILLICSPDAHIAT